MIGLIFGETEFPKEILKKIEKRHLKYLIIDLSKINGEYRENDLVKEVINFIERDKKRPICTPDSKK